MIEKIEINQENYQKILEVAKRSNSLHDLNKKLGYINYNTKKRLNDLLLKNNFDIDSFPKLHHASSIFNNEVKLKDVVKNSFTYSDVIRSFVPKVAAGHYRSLKKYIEKFNLDVSHFDPYKNNTSASVISNANLFIVNSTADCKTVRNRVIKENLIPYKCKCGNDGHWQNQKMALQMDHKNGNRTDQRLENLEFLCPNCHSITLTFGSKNRISNKRSVKIKRQDTSKRIKDNFKILRIKKIEENKTVLLSKIDGYNTLSDILNSLNLSMSERNYHALHNFLGENKTPEVEAFLNRIDRTIQYPELKKLKKMISAQGYSKVARELNCSETAVKKHIKKHTKISVQYPSLHILKQMIAEKGYNQVAKELGCSASAIKKHIIRHDTDHISIPNKKVTYPELPVLIALVKEKGYLQTGKDLGCSDNAIRKYLKKNRVELTTITRTKLAT